MLLMLLACCAPSGAEEPPSYVKPELLIEAEVLQKDLATPRSEVYDREGVVLVDVRSQEQHAQGNLAPGRRIDIGEWKSAFQRGDDAETWSRRIGAVIGDGSERVVVYDETVTPNAARAWWILKYWGVRDVSILNGGLKAWRAAGGKTYSQDAKLTAAGEFKAQAHPNRLATAEEVLSMASGGGACLIDTRSDRENAAGYIPTASHSDWTAYVSPVTGKMRSAEELKKLLDAAGFNREGRSVAYCQSGGRASVVAFAMELMGGQHVENYFGSWGEWSTVPDAPVAFPAQADE